MKAPTPNSTDAPKVKLPTSKVKPWGDRHRATLKSKSSTKKK